METVLGAKPKARGLPLTCILQKGHHVFVGIHSRLSSKSAIQTII